MKLNLIFIKNMIRAVEDLQKVTEEAKTFVLGLDVNHVTLQEYQQGLLYLVDILNILHKPPD